jgi:hypothetical protein
MESDVLKSMRREAATLSRSLLSLGLSGHVAAVRASLAQAEDDLAREIEVGNLSEVAPAISRIAERVAAVSPEGTVSEIDALIEDSEEDIEVLARVQDGPGFVRIAAAPALDAFSDVIAYARSREFDERIDRTGRIFLGALKEKLHHD